MSYLTSHEYFVKKHSHQRWYQYHLAHGFTPILRHSIHTPNKKKPKEILIDYQIAIQANGADIGVYVDIIAVKTPFNSKDLDLQIRELIDEGGNQIMARLKFVVIFKRFELKARRWRRIFEGEVIYPIIAEHKALWNYITKKVKKIRKKINNYIDF